MEKDLVIVRGLSGAGKTSFAEIVGKAVCSADDYLIDRNGNYNWHGSKLRKAHDWCYRKCERFMKIGASPVIIANTNSTEREIRPYFDLGKKYGYKVYSVIVENRHGGQNIHDVPEDVIEKMEKKFNIKLK